MERLTERKRNFNGTAISKKSMIDREGYPTVSDYASKVLTKLAAYEDAEEQGRLLRLPCKVGDTVYAFLSTNNYFIECQINKIELKPTLYGNIRYFLEQIGHRGCLYRYFEDDFGKTVFLTKEEAESKLAEMEGAE